MSKKSNESNRPTHAIWQVIGEGDRARWIRIGAAWVHKDLKGANMKFDAYPATGRVVVREITEQDTAGQDSNAASQGGEQ